MNIPKKLNNKTRLRLMMALHDVNDEQVATIIKCAVGYVGQLLDSNNDKVVPSDAQIDMLSSALTSPAIENIPNLLRQIADQLEHGDQGIIMNLFPMQKTQNKQTP